MQRPSSLWSRAIKQLFSPVPVRRSSTRLGVEQLADRLVPAGATVQTAFFDGTAQDTFDKVTMSFDQDVNPATFDATDVVITGPNGAITVNAVNMVAADQYTITFDVQNAPGEYTLNIGPNIENAGGEQMDQNRNGTPGEPGTVLAGGDVFDSKQSLVGGGTAAGPVIDIGTGFVATTPGAFDRFRVVFQPSINGVDAKTFDATDVAITDPNGQTVDIASVTEVAGAFVPTFDVMFTTPQTAVGDYTALVGPDILDVLGVAMDQNANGTPGEPGVDQFTITQPLTAAPAQGPIFAIGTVDGAVRILDADQATSLLVDFRPLDNGGAKYTGLVSVALGDFNGDQVPDLLVAAANPVGVAGLDATKAGKVFVFDGAFAAGKQPALLRTFVPFATTDGPAGTSGAYVNGLNIAVGDVNGDKQADLIAGTRGGTPTAGNAEAGRLVVIDGKSAAGANTVIGGIQKPFSAGYQKGVVVAAGDLDGDGKDEIAVTRGGPVKSTVDSIQTIKVKAFKLNGQSLSELDLTGNGSPLAPFGSVGAPGNRIIRDGRVTFVDSDGDNKDELIFTALDRSTDPTNTKIRIAAYSVNTTSGLATLVSVGQSGGNPQSYVVGNQVVDHAISVAQRTGAPNDLAIIREVKTANDSGLVFLDPLTGADRPGGVVLPIMTGGITLDGI